MSNVVQFLETLARNPKQISADEYAVLVVDAGLDSTTEGALLAKDPVGLGRGLVGDSVFACLIFPAENEPNDGEEKSPDEGEEPEQPQEPNSLAA